MTAAGGFIRASKAWNAPDLLHSCFERVQISRPGAKLSGADGELTLVWDSPQSAPELRVRHDAWELLVPEFSGLLRHLARLGAPASAEEHCALLLRLGFLDATKKLPPE